MIVRRAALDDAAGAARVLAVVAEEGFLGSQPPVDVEARAERFRELIRRGDPAALWVLEDDVGRGVGHAAVEESVPGVLSLGMAILPEARARGGGRALLDAVQLHARASQAHKISLEVWTDNPGRSPSTRPPGSRWRGCGAITTAVGTDGCAAR